jgi:nitrite reductase (NADH) large subunit
VDKENVFTFRNLNDTRGLVHAAGKGVRAVVIGGGLLGLEAARGLQLQGCDVTVVHLMDTLMNMQLDASGGQYLARKMEQLGVRVMTGRKTERLLGNGHVQGVEFAGGEEIPAEIVVVAAGIRPNAELGRKAGLTVNRGIVVNDHMETSDPRIFAVGECVEHRGQVYGLVAPLFEQGKVLAATITGNKGPVFQSWKPAAKLKIMGVDVFSAGTFEEGDGTEVVRYEGLHAGCIQEAAGARQPAGRRRSW